jgi:hypothetical protein
MDDTASASHAPRPEGDPSNLSNNEASIAALMSGGDSRLAIDPQTGTNKYLCPPTPVADQICAASCTASPITERGFRQAADAYARLIAGTSPLERARAQQDCSHDIAARLLAYFGVAGLAEAILCPSGTDALLTAAMLVGMERPGTAMTAILPQATETGTGVPRATTLRAFDGPAPSDQLLVNCSADSIEVPLRTPDGAPRGDDELNAAFASAAAAVPNRPVVYLTHGTKTGLIAPIEPPTGTDVIVDACQARIEPAMVAAYLRNGWPVVLTGSKFFGGPAFSGAVLFPAARSAASRSTAERVAAWPSNAWAGNAGAGNAGAGNAGAGNARAGNAGMLLRWIAALDAIEAFAPLAASMPDRLRGLAASIEQGLAGIDGVVPVRGLSDRGAGWSGVPTIFTFAVRDPADRQRLLSAAELRPLYTRLANRRVLLGQPVGLGRFGGLRIAVGARDLLPGAPADAGLPGLFAALGQAVRL